MLKINKAVNNGNKAKKKVETSLENQISEKSKMFLRFSKTLFGDYLTDFIEKELKEFSEENQFEIVWHILHYMYSEELLPTGDPDVDIKISEIIEKLPLVNVQLFRNLSQEKYGKPRKADEVPQFFS